MAALYTTACITHTVRQHYGSTKHHYAYNTHIAIATMWQTIYHSRYNAYTAKATKWKD